VQKVIPAILEQDPAETKRKLELLKGSTEWVQVDIMDGKFVEGITHKVREIPEGAKNFKLEIHLMVERPEEHLAECKAVGANRVFFHLHGAENPARVLRAMEAYEFERGISLNPETGTGELAPYVADLHAVLLLSVHPGLQGREFLPSVLDKIKEVRALNPLLLVGMDGGIGEGNIRQVFGAGADYVAVGSGIWRSSNPQETLKTLEQMV